MDMTDDTVYARFSMGAASTQYLAGTISGASGAVLLHAAINEGGVHALVTYKTRKSGKAPLSSEVKNEI